MKRSAIVFVNSSEHRHIHVIRFLVTAMAVALASSLAANAAEASPAPLHVSVDPRVELFSVICHLAGSPAPGGGSTGSLS